MGPGRRDVYVPGLPSLLSPNVARPFSHRPPSPPARRHVYTTPKSFLEMTRLYKGLLAAKRATVTASIQRLEAGLAKLRKTQGDVDVLVEQARTIAAEVRLLEKLGWSGRAAWGRAQGMQGWAGRGWLASSAPVDCT